MWSADWTLHHLRNMSKLVTEANLCDYQCVTRVLQHHTSHRPEVNFVLCHKWFTPVKLYILLPSFCPMSNQQSILMACCFNVPTIDLQLHCSVILWGKPLLTGSNSTNRMPWNNQKKKIKERLTDLDKNTVYMTSALISWISHGV